VAPIIVALIRLLIWHWLQPVGYIWLLSLYWPTLHGMQLVFGVLVGVRESLYLLSTLVCLWYKPAFLLIDVNATVRFRHSKGKNGMAFLAMYVLAPEKFVATVLFQSVQQAFDPVGNALRVAEETAFLDTKFAIRCDDGLACSLDHGHVRTDTGFEVPTALCKERQNG